jgi:hypothetical protein
MSTAGVQSWTFTAADNTTINGINIAENCPAANINNAIRQAMSSVLQEIAYQGPDISASASISLAGVDWRFMAVTGSASIIHVGTGRAGLVRNVIWNSPSTLVNSANILCDGAANIVAATNDMTMFTSLGSGAWRAVHFPVAGFSIADGSITAAKLATDAVETSKIATNAVTFGKMQAITDGRILGASGSTAISEISIGSGLTLATGVLSSSAGAAVAFSANKNGVNQNIASASDVKITATTELFDVGGYYDAANSRFTPLVAGQYTFTLNVTMTSTNMSANQVFNAMIWKNGAVAASQTTYSGNASGQLISVPITATLEANGSTDYFEAYVNMTSGTGTMAADGTATKTWFEGFKVA